MSVKLCTKCQLSLLFRHAFTSRMNEVQYNKHVTHRCQFGTANITEIWGPPDGGNEIKILRHDAVQIGTDVCK